MEVGKISHELSEVVRYTHVVIQDRIILSIEYFYLFFRFAKLSRLYRSWRGAGGVDMVTSIKKCQINSL
jgi:hypothetical protein